MMCHPVYNFVLPLPVAMLDTRKSLNRQARRNRIYGKGRKYLREWGL